MNITDQGYLQSISRCDIAEPVVLIMFSSWKRLKIAKGESEEGGHILQWKKEKEQKDKE
jgi:hypothetical protein